MATPKKTSVARRALAWALALASSFAASADPLVDGFRTPPHEALPHTYWLWLNGSMHEPTAKAELKAMREAGIGGVLLFEMGARGDKANAPVPGPAFLSEAWVGQLKTVLAETRRLGMQVDMSVISSWDLGGPWIEPRHASMALYSTEARLKGGARVEAKLPFPAAEPAAPRGPDGKPAFWTEVAVLAVRNPKRLPAHEFILRLDPDSIHDLREVALDNGKPNAPAPLAASLTPTRDFSVAVSSGGFTEPEFKEVVRGSLAAAPGRQVFALPPGTQARYVRLRLHSGHEPDRPRWTLGEFEVVDRAGRNVAMSHQGNQNVPGARVMRAPVALNYATWNVTNLHDASTVGANGVFAPAGLPAFDLANASDVVDVTRFVGRDDTLRWDAPTGDWQILRFVCMVTGERLKVPSPSSDGLTSDHLSAEATRVHMDHVIAQLRAGLGSDLRGAGLRNLYLASYEVVGKVWSPSFPEEFRKRRGYALTRYLPAIFGARVDDEQTTERFLFDYQKTLGEVLVDAYYRTAAEVARKVGLEIKSEAGGPGPPIHTPPVDALLAHGTVDNVQGEFWPFWDDNDAINVIKEPASAAHLYGKRRVHLESFTSFHHWAEGPQDLKHSADRVFCEGGNHFVWHTWTHQPPEAGVPGWVYGAGTHLNRNVTWWPQAHVFLSYLARGSFLLQRGRFVADALYYYGDGGLNFVGPRKQPASLGAGYDYDVTNADVILNRLSVRDGRLTTPEGVSYAVLVLPDQDAIHPAVLGRIEQLVSDGATVIGRRPSCATGLEGYPGSDRLVRDIAVRLWGDLDGRARTSRAHGKGLVVWGVPERDILARKGLAPDFTAPADFDFTHRRDDEAGADIYFVRNRTSKPISGTARFRVSGRTPELWDPRTASIAPASGWRSRATDIEVPLTLAANGSIFVVFRDKASALVSGNARASTLKSSVSGAPAGLAPLPVAGPWTVAFRSAAPGAPAPLSLARLAPWTDQEAPALKYFTGTGRYSCTIDVPAGWRERAGRVALDLGHLWVIGEVWVNGKPLGVAWTPPFSVDCTEVLRDGTNEIVVEVTNTWHNRITGEAKGALPKWTRSTISVSQRKAWKDHEPIPSGLFGPVRLVPVAPDKP